MSDYCYAQKSTNNENCNNAMQSLKSQLSHCENKSISDNTCQKFKEKFCSALPHFACCAYVIPFFNFY